MTGVASSGAVVWITGRPSAGKSTLAQQAHEQLQQRGRPACVLDSDLIRESLVPAPDYSPAGRDNFYATLTNLATMLAEQGLVVLVAATANRRRYRDAARANANRFVELLVDTSLQEAQRRDSKGLYRAAKEGRVDGVPGFDEPYEVPEQPELVAVGGCDPTAVAGLLELLGEPPPLEQR